MWETAISCSKETKIYIFCPAGTATGGPEALHQLGHHLNILGFNAFMFYYATPDGRETGNDVYKKYEVPYTSKIKNDVGNVMVLPETYLAPLFKSRYGKIRKAVWWLSVVNYYRTQRDIDQANNTRRSNFWRRITGRKVPTFELLRTKGILNIAHSWYSVDHLRANGIEPVGQISDYMNEAFFSTANEAMAKEDIIIYNPKKNDVFLDEIRSQVTEFEWKPLSGMTPEGVAEWMKKAKLYIDFGYHPGKERMPREACIMKCCLIIGKTGSAAFAEDMPIPDQYRFEKNEMSKSGIISLIRECINNYQEHIRNFEDYRARLHEEANRFNNDISRLFRKI
jgi:hypothetical protein